MKIQFSLVSQKILLFFLSSTKRAIGKSYLWYKFKLTKKFVCWALHGCLILYNRFRLQINLLLLGTSNGTGLYFWLNVELPFAFHKESFTRFVDFLETKIAFWFIHSRVNYNHNDLQDWSVNVTRKIKTMKPKKGRTAASKLPIHDSR